MEADGIDMSTVIVEYVEEQALDPVPGLTT